MATHGIDILLCACSEEVLKRYGGIDALVNAAGFTAYGKENVTDGACGRALCVGAVMAFTLQS